MNFAAKFGCGHLYFSWSWQLSTSHNGHVWSFEQVTTWWKFSLIDSGNFQKLQLCSPSNCGAFEAKWESIRLQNIFEDATSSLATLSESKSVVLTASSDELLHEAVLHCDKLLISKLYSLLLENAIQASPNGGKVD